MDKLSIYFDFAKINNKVMLGIVAYEKEGSLKTEFKKLINIPEKETAGFNQFHCSIKALGLALQELGVWIKKNKKEDLKVSLLNQNELVFKWLQTQSYSLDYAELYDEVYIYLENVVEYCTFDFRVIKGKDNRAKKVLKNESSMVKPANNDLDFSHIRQRLNDSKEVTEKRRYAGESRVVELERFKI